VNKSLKTIIGLYLRDFEHTAMVTGNKDATSHGVTPILSKDSERELDRIQPKPEGIIRDHSKNNKNTIAQDNHNMAQSLTAINCTVAVDKALHGMKRGAQRGPTESRDPTIAFTINNSLAGTTTEEANKSEDPIIGRTINNSMAETTRDVNTKNQQTENTYSHALTQNAGPWNTPTPKGKRTAIKTLKGQKNVKTWIIYVNNIWVDPGQTPNDITSSLKSFCRNSNVTVIHTEIVSNRRREDVVGCKVTIPKHQVNKVKEKDFWPEFITCRDWSFKPKFEGTSFKGKRLWDLVDEENSRHAKGYYNHQKDTYRNWHNHS
jgi:hypothetical protein